MPQEEKSITQVIQELKELTISYAKQETVDPLKTAGRWVGYGVGGSFLMAIGGSMIGLGLLRFLQTETGTRFTGNWSWVPYFIVFLILGGIAGLMVLQIKKDGDL